MSISISLTPAELALAQSCAAALPALLSAYETAPAQTVLGRPASVDTAFTTDNPPRPYVVTNPAVPTVYGKDDMETQLRAVMTDPARALFQKLQNAHYNDLLATVTAAFLPYFNAPEGAQSAAAQSDAVASQAGGSLLAYGDVYSAAKVAVQRFTEAIS